MRVLITNHALANPGGTEMFVTTTALALKAKGIDVWVYTPRLGAAAIRLIEAGVSVHADPSLIPHPDVIHGQHKVVRAACTTYPNVPRLFMAHGSVPQEEQPPAGISFAAHLAISEGVADHLRTSHKIEHVEIIRNGLDMDAWSCLPPPRRKPERVLLLKNVVDPAAEADLSNACNVLGASYERVGGQASTWDVAAAIERADVVVSWGRGALEAMATGRTVIGFGHDNLLDGVITPRNFELFRSRSFSGRTQMIPCSSKAFMTEIQQHNVVTAATVAARVHAEHDVRDTAARLINIYEHLSGTV